MMILKEVSLEHKSELKYIEKLYLASFPAEERRPISEMYSLLKNQPNFKIILLLESSNNQRIGFLTYWLFDFFIFLEHFAIDPQLRGSGYGKYAINALISTVTLPIIGEIELPTESLEAERRMSFYVKVGFRVWDVPYMQPPYEKKYAPIPMLLISYGDINLSKEFIIVKKELDKKVYNLY